MWVCGQQRRTPGSCVLNRARARRLVPLSPAAEEPLPASASAAALPSTAPEVEALPSLPLMREHGEGPPTAVPMGPLPGAVLGVAAPGTVPGGASRPRTWPISSPSNSSSTNTTSTKRRPREICRPPWASWPHCSRQSPSSQRTSSTTLVEASADGAACTPPSCPCQSADQSADQSAEAHARRSHSMSSMGCAK
jgi:hypothetical protein